MFKLFCRNSSLFALAIVVRQNEFLYVVNELLVSVCCILTCRRHAVFSFASVTSEPPTGSELSMDAA